MSAALHPVTEAPNVVDLAARVPGSLGAPLRRAWTRVRRRLGLLHPFAVEAATPPRPDPVVLSGSLWAVTAFFNPSGSPLPKRNYDRFRRGVLRDGVPLLAVEMAFDERPFELGPSDADVCVQVRGGDLLWQKDRLLNLGIQRLPETCDRVAWLDADILFDRPDWARQTARLLETYAVVQPFLRRVRLEQGQENADVATLPVGMADGQVHYGIAYGVAAKSPSVLSSYRRHGSTGFAWAARRSLLARHGLYDRLIVGGSDLVWSRALFRGWAGLRSSAYAPAVQRHLSAWCDAVHADVRGSVAYADATVFHLWHGSSEGRRYATRGRGLVEHAYDPEQDVAALPDGPLVWSTDKQGLKDWVAEYFAGRNASAAVSRPGRPLPPTSRRAN